MSLLELAILVKPDVDLGKAVSELAANGSSRGSASGVPLFEVVSSVRMLERMFFNME